MTYSDNFVATIKCNGNILRERNGVFYLPFGSEYEIYLKNMNSKRAQVNVDIDGRPAVQGLVLNADQSITLERFVDDDLDSGYKFKFIEKTEDIRKHRGDHAEDGLIRIEYWFEKQPRYWWIFEEPYRYRCPHDIPFIYRQDCCTKGSSNYLSSSLTCSDDIPLASAMPDDEGITVEGGDSNQRFVPTSMGPLELRSHVIVLHLKGRTTKAGIVKKAITVKRKIECNYCGRHSRSSNKFCPNCGARLI